MTSRQTAPDEEDPMADEQDQQAAGELPAHLASPARRAVATSGPASPTPSASGTGRLQPPA
jgi:hypothetical protein